MSSKDTIKKENYRPISDGYRCKNSQQNISKPNPTTHKKYHAPWPSGIHPKFTRVVQHTQTTQCDTQRKQKTTDTCIISIGAEKASDKIQYPFMINLTKVEYRGNISQDNTSYSWQIYSQYNSGKKLKDFPLKSGTRMPTHLFYST